MKKRYKWLILAILLGLFLFQILLEPSDKKTVAFAVRHQEALEDLIALCRKEYEAGTLWRIEPDCLDLYRNFYSYTLIDHLEPYFEEAPASAELSAAWKRVKRYGYFKRMICVFDENGALEIDFCTLGKWISYQDGKYCHSHCLRWRDKDYDESSLEYWHPIGAADGIPDSPEGGWYYTYKKHYDG